jgi:GST-like protein
LKLYFNPRPNPLKVALFLEEAALDYDVVPVDLLIGEQFEPAFRYLNPNSKVPVLVDGESVIFDSTAILLYLVGKTGKYGPADSDAMQGDFLSWLLFIATGLAPYSGQAVHFRYHAPAPQDYALNRYSYEAERHWRIIEERLAANRFLLGDRYTAADMSLWGWAPALPYLLHDDAAWDRFPNLVRWLEEIERRPAVAKAKAIEGRFSFKSEIDEETLRIMFPHNVPLSQNTQRGA